MSLLYPKEENIIYSVEIKRFSDGLVNLFFTSNGGKFGTDETLAEYNLTPKRLLEILNDRDDYKENEL